jgi:hypothetical protein
MPCYMSTNIIDIKINASFILRALRKFQPTMPGSSPRTVEPSSAWYRDVLRPRLALLNCARWLSGLTFLRRELASRSGEVCAPAIGDNEPDAETTPSFYVLTTVGKDGAVRLADGHRVAADFHG